VDDQRPNAFSRVRSALGRRWDRLNEHRPGLRHIVAAWKLLQVNNGNQYAAAITYFSFLALFPLLLLAVAVTGFVLHSHPAAQQSLLDHITANVPGDLGKTLQSSVRTAIKARTGVGIVGLVGVLLTGLGWIGNLRAAIDGVWGRRAAPTNFLRAKLANLFVLAGLGLGVLVSLGLTVIGTALTDQILRAADLDHVAGVHWLVTVLGVALAVVGDVLIFWWLLVRLPGVPVPRRVGLQGALLAAVGLEVLKIAGTFTIAKTAHSPTAGPFAGLVAVLIWIQLVARFMLFCAAWTATCEGCALGPQDPGSKPVQAGGEPVPATAAAARSPAAGERAGGEVPDAPSAALVAGSLIGAGAVAGGALVAWLNSRRRDVQGDRSRSSR
jgi:membrane protein